MSHQTHPHDPPHWIIAALPADMEFPARREVPWRWMNIPPGGIPVATAQHRDKLSPAAVSTVTARTQRQRIVYYHRIRQLRPSGAKAGSGKERETGAEHITLTSVGRPVQLGRSTPSSSSSSSSSSSRRSACACSDVDPIVHSRKNNSLIESINRYALRPVILYEAAVNSRRRPHDLHERGRQWRPTAFSP